MSRSVDDITGELMALASEMRESTQGSRSPGARTVNAAATQIESAALSVIGRLLYDTAHPQQAAQGIATQRAVPTIHDALKAAADERAQANAEVQARRGEEGATALSNAEIRAQRAHMVCNVPVVE